MSIDLSKALVGSILEQPDAVRPPDPRETGDGVRHVPEVHFSGMLPPGGYSRTGNASDTLAHDRRPLDWNQAVDAAAARLEESWVRPDETGRMLASGLAGELAATLCAFGMMVDEFDHMHDHADRHAAWRRWFAEQPPG
jgi:hypothetical protein